MGVTQFVDRLVRHTHDIEVHDRSTTGAVDDVDDTGQERLLGVAGHDECPRLHTIRLVGRVEEGPQVAGLIDCWTSAGSVTTTALSSLMTASSRGGD